MAADDHVLKLIIDRQESIFSELKGINDVLQTVAIQKNELEHVKEEMLTLKKNCSVNHAVKERTLFEEIFRTIILTVAGTITVAALSFTGYMVVKNVPGYAQDQKGKS